MIYKALDRIRFEDGRVLDRGKTSRLAGIRLRAIQFLIDRGALHEVQTPPLEILPGWERRAKVLKERAGITFAAELITANLEEVAEKTRISMRALRAAREDVLQYVEYDEE